MKFIKDLTPGDRIADIYMCKHKLSATTKNGKEYYSVTLQDKTGTIDAKIWEPNSDGIDEFDDTDYIDVFGEVTSFNGALQINVKRARKCHEGEYDPSLYLPVSSKDIDVMYKELLGIIGTIGNPYLKKLLEEFFIQDEAFITAFRKSSAAKTVHHSFIGGLLEHTLSVTKLCNFYCTAYPALNRDLLLTAAICHDIGKTKELSLYPVNDYTDEGQFLGHIVMGTEMVGEKIRGIEGFPVILKQELQHCILAHHGELEYGSPKKPAIIEAVALNLADNTDAKMETFTEILGNITTPGWQGFNKFFESNIYSTKIE
ncbi:3'-5' exoribonuclease YhaM family protein [Butyrivibrio sp.]|uniref:3'-5' exoribonuclease YhaM family protein n=1 Tax=Butyrivibrio sp. TaxID=28121 RepID=UPI001B412F38|nr:HD domain-containing protein [Butyrivibrio sp.]MBE5836570.1 HD domain-containing protein [Butyrivibrio sp.]MBP3818883.1 HD domain-containing protein [Butyrivibrio sp.]MBQ9302544.1 HD domain-containing protein [Butyrivibrio sp.]